MAMIGGLPPPRPDQWYNPPAPPGPVGGAAGVLRAREVIIIGPNGKILLYNPTQAAGNLVDSMAALGGVDSGNLYLAGETSYAPAGPGYEACQNFGGVLTFYTAVTEAGPWTTTALVGLQGSTGTILRVRSVSGPVLLSSVNGGVCLLGPSGDATGVTDSANIAAAFTLASHVMLTPGTFSVNGLVTVAGATLSGADMATVMQPGGGYAGPLLAAGSKGVIRNLSVENSGSDAITVAGGISEWWLTELFFAGNTGSCINATITGPAHGRIRGIRGAGGASANGGGIRLDAGTGGAVTAEVNIYDIDIQGCTASEVLFASSVTDVLADVINGSMKAGVVSSAITIQGACQTVHLRGIDVGGPGASGVTAVFKAAGANSPTDCLLEGKLQAGNVGLLVSDSTARCRFDVQATRNQTDGVQFNGTGAFNVLLPMCNQNNLAAVIAYDVNITSTAHVWIERPQWASPAVTANLNIALAGNHVTSTQEPAGSTHAGNAQAGW